MVQTNIGDKIGGEFKISVFEGYIANKWDDEAHGSVSTIIGVEHLSFLYWVHVWSIRAMRSLCIWLTLFLDFYF